jgi:hypothetical protein
MSQYGAYGYSLHLKTYDFILGHYYTGTALGQLDSNPEIKVLLQGGKRTISFTGALDAGGESLDPAKTYSVRRHKGALLLRDSAGKDVATTPGPLRVDAPVGQALRLMGGSVPGVRDGLYRGALLISASGSGLIAVNALDLEDYVRGVVSGESPAGWPPEALKAQAVAARTYALTTHAGGAAFDQWADTRSQVYRGVAAETPSTDAAVQATKGQVVTYGGQPATTYFFSTSGGETEGRPELVPELAADAVAEGRRRSVRFGVPQAPLGADALHRHAGAVQAAPLPAGALQAHQGGAARRLAARGARPGGRHARRDGHHWSAAALGVRPSTTRGRSSPRSARSRPSRRRSSPRRCRAPIRPVACRPWPAPPRTRRRAWRARSPGACRPVADRAAPPGSRWVTAADAHVLRGGRYSVAVPVRGSTAWSTARPSGRTSASVSGSPVNVAPKARDAGAARQGRGTDGEAVGPEGIPGYFEGRGRGLAVIGAGISGGTFAGGPLAARVEPHELLGHAHRLAAPSHSNVCVTFIWMPPGTSSTLDSTARMRTRESTCSGAGKRTRSYP